MGSSCSILNNDILENVCNPEDVDNRIRNYINNNKKKRRSSSNYINSDTDENEDNESEEEENDENNINENNINEYRYSKNKFKKHINPLSYIFTSSVIVYSFLSIFNNTLNILI